MDEVIAFLSKRGSTVLVVCCVLALAKTAEASPPYVQPAGCVFDVHRPRAVEPYYVEQSLEAGRDQVLRGAVLFVPASAGLTKEWLELSIRHAFAAAPEASARCLPGVRNVDIAVGSAGIGFWVYLGSLHAPEELLRWAKETLKRSAS